MESKKISFGFMKTKKVDKPTETEEKDFIECVEENSIKLIGVNEIKEDVALVIPMRPNTLVTAERLKQIAEEVESVLDEPEVVEKQVSILEEPPKNETLEEMAIRELVQDAKKEVEVEVSQISVPLTGKSVKEGENESTLEDYESVPIQDFGLAMLRGMGWAPTKESSKYKPPQLRPKGLGLGADKMVNDKQKQKSTYNAKGEELTIVKNAYVKVTVGKYSGYYGKVLSLDDENGRVMVDIVVKKETVSLNEFMLHPVTKAEYDKESKVINARIYEEYKRDGSTNSSRKSKESKSSNTEDYYKSKSKYGEDLATLNKKNDSKNYETESIDKDTKSSKINNSEEKSNSSNEKLQRSRLSDCSDEGSSKKINKQYSSDESLSYLSDSEKKRKEKREPKGYKSDEDSHRSVSNTERKRNKHKKNTRHYSSDSESDLKSKRNKTPDNKRDIDKKRKGKKKKRDRDRSPNYRKHRK